MTASARRLAGILALAVALTLSACSSSRSVPVSERPVLSVAVAEYDGVLAQLRGIVADAAPGTAWSSDGEGHQSFGGDSGTVSYRSDGWSADGTLTAEQRASVLAAANEVLAANGFGDFAAVVSDEDRFSFVADDQWGAVITFSGMKNMTIRYRTGSHPEG